MKGIRSDHGVGFRRDGKVIQGQDGWLFLANDSNDVLDQHTGVLTLSQDHLERWSQLLEGRLERLTDRGAQYLFMAAPDTHAVYPEKLPPDIELVEQRPIHKLMGYLEQTGSPARVIYPLEELVALKPTRLVCSASHTHWTPFGALVAYERLMDLIEQTVPVRRVSRGHVIYASIMVPGELSVKIGVERDVEQQIALIHTTARLLEDNGVINVGSHVVLECSSAPPTTCVVFGDSYTLAMLGYLAESFGRVVWVHMPMIDYELVERERPDVVVSLFCERFLISIPDDSAGTTVDDLAREKREQGKTRERLWLWEPAKVNYQLVPLEIVEQIRAEMLAQDALLDATLVSVLAYGGIRLVEARTLRWEHLDGETLMIVPRDGSASRSIRLVEPLVDDLEAWRRACGWPASGKMFRPEGAWAKWRDHTFRGAAKAAGAEEVRVKHLFNCLPAMLVRAGDSFEEVAERIAGTPLGVLTWFGPLIEDLDREGAVPVEIQVGKAREAATESLRQESKTVRLHWPEPAEVGGELARAFQS